MKKLLGLCLLLLVAAPVLAQVRPLHHLQLMRATIRAAERPVDLADVAIRVEPVAGHARTTIDMVFRNPNARPLEGNLEFPLRPGQQVVGFALDVDGHMRDAVPVEKARGRQVFDAIERQGVDPGLLEQTQGEFFRLRVFPLPSQGTRHVRVVLSEPLRVVPGGVSTTLSLDFARSRPVVPIEIRSPVAPTVRGAVLGLTTERVRRGLYRVHAPRGSVREGGGLELVFAMPEAPAVQVQTRGDARYFVAEVPVPHAVEPRSLPARMGLLWDSSMSGQDRAHDLEFALLDEYFRRAGSIEVELVRLRDVAGPVRRFHVEGGDWSALRSELEATVYDGASRLDGWTPDPAVGEYLLASDGLFNYGGGLPELAAGQRLYTVRAGVAGDDARLTALANAHGGRAIALDDRADLEPASRALLTDGTRLTAIRALGATEVLAESPFPVDGRLRLAGRLAEATPSLQLALDGPQGPGELDVLLGDAVETGAAAWTWARYKLAQLQAEPERNRAAMAHLGREFGLVTPQTSLIVLENVADYARYDIAPPAELRDEYDALVRSREAGRDAAGARQLEGVAQRWQERIEWWEKPFDKGPPPADKLIKRPRPVSAAPGEPPVVFDEPSPVDAPAPPPPPAPPAPQAMREAVAADAAAAASQRSTLNAVSVEGARAEPAATMHVQPWLPDSPVARRLRAASAEEAYAIYLDERGQGRPSPALFLDVADALFEKRQPALALRVLSNLAEMQLEDRHVLRVLAYRLMQAGRADLARPVLEQVLAMGEEEPQSYRDLALAHAALGNLQQAIDLLYEVVTGSWDGRFADIEIIALAELNALVATSPRPLDTRRIRPGFLRNLPLGLRAVLSWDSDQSDMDLWVTDPNGERAYYGNRLTYQGGHMSRDFTGGYGPEEFALRAPKPGIYKVEANYFGDRQPGLAGPTTLQVWLSTGFGTAHQADERITLRLNGKDDQVFVGEFEVK